jgi:hypothetical protein
VAASNSSLAVNNATKFFLAAVSSERDEERGEEEEGGGGDIRVWIATCTLNSPTSDSENAESDLVGCFIKNELKKIK